MRIQSKYRRIKGCVTVYNRAVRYAYMITSVAKRRHKILEHWKKHGLVSTTDAFDVSERTLWYWKGRLDAGGGKLESLNPGKREPQMKRKRIWDPRILDEIRRLRSADVHPNLGKEKIHPLLKEFIGALDLGECPSPMTIGRLIKDMGSLRTAPKKVSHFGKIKKANRKKAQGSGSSLPRTRYGSRYDREAKKWPEDVHSDRNWHI